jgi:hypothetical protein
MRWGPEWTLQFVRPDGRVHEVGPPRLRDEIRRRFDEADEPPEPPPR